MARASNGIGPDVRYALQRGDNEVTTSWAVPHLHRSEATTSREGHGRIIHGR
jgi:hypothetical protein